MKLLLDQNISARLVETLLLHFPESRHVSRLGLGSATDLQIWDHARSNGFAIVSRDADFHHMSVLYGAPPKIVWLRLGNCSTADIGRCLLSNVERLKAFADDETTSLLILGR